MSLYSEPINVHINIHINRSLLLKEVSVFYGVCRIYQFVCIIINAQGSDADVLAHQFT